MVYNSWGSSTDNYGGIWYIGDRKDQRVLEINVASSDGGDTLLGTMRYANEGPIRFKATLDIGSGWYIENQWGGTDTPWNKAGFWMIGNRPNQPIISWSISSTDGGATYQGTCTYKGEGPIGFSAKKTN